MPRLLDEAFLSLAVWLKLYYIRLTTIKCDFIEIFMIQCACICSSLFNRAYEMRISVLTQSTQISIGQSRLMYKTENNCTVKFTVLLVSAEAVTLLNREEWANFLSKCNHTIKCGSSQAAVTGNCCSVVKSNGLTRECEVMITRHDQ